MTSRIFAMCELVRIVNASPFSNQTPTISNAGFYYDAFAVSSGMVFNASGEIIGVPAADNYKLLIFAWDETTSEWYSGPQNWLATIDSEGNWQLDNISTTAPEYAAVLMTADFYTQFCQANFPDNSDAAVKTLPTATANPGAVILQIAWPPGFNRTLLMLPHETTIAPGQSITPGVGMTSEVTSIFGPDVTDPLTLTSAQGQQLLCDLPGVKFLALDNSGNQTGWGFVLSFYAAAIGAPLYFLVAAGYFAAGYDGTPPAGTPIISGASLGTFDNPGTGTAQLNFDVTVTILADSVVIQVVSAHFTESQLQELEKVFAIVTKAILKITFRGVMILL